MRGLHPVQTAPAAADHELHDAALGGQALVVVVVSRERDDRPALEPLPEGLDVLRVPVLAGAVAGAVPEADRARPVVARQVLLQPGHLPRAGTGVLVAVQRYEVPAG